MIKFDVKNRFTGNVQFTAEIDCDESAPPSVKLGLAVKWALKAGTNLRGANLDGAYLRGVNLRGADLDGAYLRGTNLRGANLDGAYLRGTNLRGADLEGVNLEGVDLSYADLRGANMRGANLRGAHMRGADLIGADLESVNLDGANLRGANLDGAYLRYANLDGADLDGANLIGALGNSRQIKTLQTDIWTVTYTSEVMQIGCQRHDIADWWAFDDEFIDDMDVMALEWWERWKPVLKTIVTEISPAQPTGAKAAEAAA